MKKDWKKAIGFFLVATTGLGASACVFPPFSSSSSTGGNSEIENSSSTVEEEFTILYTDGTKKSLPTYEPSKSTENEKVVYEINANLFETNYLKMELETDVDLVGYIEYSNNMNPAEKNTEKFFIERNSTEFKTFLDAFRIGARGNFMKTITKISFQNTEEKRGSFTLKAVGVSARSIDTKKMLYITDGYTVMGTSPFHGGGISYLSRKDAGICEYLDKDGNVHIRRNAPKSDVDRLISEEVNLVNISDLGREIQASYYSLVGKEHGYNPNYNPEDKDSYYQGLGDRPLYNPIQCGDAGDHSPQVIDYEYEKDRLYMKVKAQEWFFRTNIQANGYIEATYYFVNGAVIAENRYTDFSEFVGEEALEARLQETPAAYIVHPLNYFYCETAMGVVFDNNLSSITSGAVKKNFLHQSVGDHYYYQLERSAMAEEWCAFVNEDKFGVGLFMPNADAYTASRGMKSTNYYNDEINRNYHQNYFHFDAGEIVPSYATFNYNYMNTGVFGKMVDFIPFEYSYALYVGDVKEMKERFGELKEYGFV
ncbi:MAG: hypothetical protein IKZ28_04975, partial [Clostridia bacterium]|nr:hypothetical protein [Clostridia bacterium]